MVSFALAALVLGAAGVGAGVSAGNVDFAVGDNTTYTPVICMHGIDGDAGDFSTLVGRLQKAHPGQSVTSLPLFEHALSFLPIWDQIPIIQDKVRSLTVGMDNYHLMCHSQGGIVCRALIETMNNHKVKNFVSLAGVQQGVRAIPPSYVSFLPSWLTNATDEEVYHLLYTKAGQDISFGNYWRDPAPYARKLYLEYDALLPVVDNDPEATTAVPKVAITAAERKVNFQKVAAVHLFGSPHDGVVSPWDSSLFATVNSSDKTGATSIPMEQQPLYINDWFGLKTMDEAGRVHRNAIEGVVHHGWLSREDLFDAHLEPILR